MTGLCSTTTVSAYLLEGLPGATVESADGIVLLKKKNCVCEFVMRLNCGLNRSDALHTTNTTKKAKHTASSFYGRMQGNGQTTSQHSAKFSLLFHCLISQSLNNMHAFPGTEQDDIRDQACCHAFKWNQCILQKEINEEACFLGRLHIKK